MLRALRRGQQSATLTTSPQNNCPPSLEPSRRRRPYPARRPGGPGAGGEAEGREGRALPAEQSPRHALLTPRADKRSLRGCRSHAPSARARWAKCGHRGERPGLGGRPGSLTGPRPPLTAGPRARHAPRPPSTPSSGGAPRCPNLRRLPTMGSPTPPAAASGRGQAGGAGVPGPGARGAAAPARPPASHHPPAARRQRGRHLENRAYFSRACPSEGTAEPLPLANMFCREEGAEPRRRRRRRRRRYRSGCSRAAPSLPAPSPALARSLARAFLAAIPSLPPRRWLRALSSCQSVSPGRGPIALELLPRRLGLGCRCRRRRRRRRSPVGPAARWLARAPPARLRLRRPLRLQHRCRRRRCRWSTWSSTERGYPGEGARRASTSRD